MHTDYSMDSPNREPHKLTRDLVSGFDSMPYPERRIVFQALPLADAQWLCHLLAAHRPTVFRSPDHAWRWFRSSIEPNPWDITPDIWQSGDHYVAHFGGQPVMAHPRDGTPDALETCYRNLTTWFDMLYPKHLIDTYTQPLEVSHVSSPS